MSDDARLPGSARRSHAASAPETAPVWHNLVFGIISLVLILGPLWVPDVTYVDVFIGIESVSVTVFMLLLLGGLFRDFLPSGRHRGKHR